MAKPASKDASKGIDENKSICGIIMPISAMSPDYEAAHWLDVRRVLDDAICDADMQPQIVSDSFEADVIQRRIVHNLYNNPVVVCDVSGLNPNVMFELGMRLTFKKPIVIVTDSVDRIPFDTSVIEHIPYPRDLHIHKMRDFSEKLTDRIKVLHAQITKGEFKSYLEAFGKFEVFQPTTENVPADRYIVDRIEDLSRAVRDLERVSRKNYYPTELVSRNISSTAGRDRTIRISMPKTEETQRLSTRIIRLDGVNSVSGTTEGAASIFTIEIGPGAPKGIERRIYSIIDESTGG